MLYGSHDDGEERAAEAFARHLHDSWGVGDQTSKGGTGVLVFLSIHDRVMYISRGAALDRILTDSRIDRIITGLKPILRQGRYGEALLETVDAIKSFLQQGEPSLYEKFMILLPEVIPFLVIGFFLLYVVVSARKQQRDQREYARVASQLSELDRTRAEALQGQYQATSCPICLEDFKSTTEGSDDLPIKLLRCGHVFDETCWAEWVGSGQGNVSKCPICQKDVGTGSEAPPPAARRAADVDAPRPLGGAADVIQRRNAPPPADAFHNHVHHDDDIHRNDDTIVEDHSVHQERALQNYQWERNFRLARLMARYPRYIQPQQVQRWTQTTYDGSLVRDPAFVQHDPKLVSQSSSSTNSQSGSSSFRSFGGGFSSGGRGGRW